MVDELSRVEDHRMRQYRWRYRHSRLQYYRFSQQMSPLHFNLGITNLEGQVSRHPRRGELFSELISTAKWWNTVQLSVGSRRVFPARDGDIMLRSVRSVSSSRATFLVRSHAVQIASRFERSWETRKGGGVFLCPPLRVFLGREWSVRHRVRKTHSVIRMMDLSQLRDSVTKCIEEPSHSGKKC